MLLKNDLERSTPWFYFSETVVLFCLVTQLAGREYMGATRHVPLPPCIHSILDTTEFDQVGKPRQAYGEHYLLSVAPFTYMV